MISPDIKDLMKNMDSRYTLVVTAAKRARQLTAGAEPLTRFRSDKTVTLAIHEIAEGKVEYFRDAIRLPYDAVSEYRVREDAYDYGDDPDMDGAGAADGFTGQGSSRKFEPSMYDDGDGYGDDDADIAGGGGYREAKGIGTEERDGIEDDDPEDSELPYGDESGRDDGGMDYGYDDD